jgi:hypothetical protein
MAPCVFQLVGFTLFFNLVAPTELVPLEVGLAACPRSDVGQTFYRVNKNASLEQILKRACDGSSSTEVPANPT